MPTFTGTEVKFTDVPAQIAPGGFAVILRVAAEVVFTEIVIVLEAAVVAVKQIPPVTVISQVIVLPFTSAVEVNVFEVLLCTLVPFTLKL